MSKTMFPEDLFLQGAMFDFYKPRSLFVEAYEFEASLTRQEFAEDCDINTIMSRYEVTGMLPASASVPQFGDYSDAPDLMTALNALNAAQDAFMTLPARVRREFENDPVQFVEFAQDPENLDQMRTWGLAPPAPAERPPVADRPISELTASEFADLTREAPKPA